MVREVGFAYALRVLLAGWPHKSSPHWAAILSSSCFDATRYGRPPIERATLHVGFSVDFPPPAPSAAKLYLINTAYAVGDRAGEATWHIKDFAAGSLEPCR